ncbi:hypothetical protein [Phenylobacterium immobile]|uniref:hypothetical protein n=1 Tax=Phenylobacterium immobile TaxID=21 RepID=UPI000B8467FA|nr:hypothetical protein [Phenylobacterium immobile]
MQPQQLSGASIHGLLRIEHLKGVAARGQIVTQGRTQVALSVLAPVGARLFQARRREHCQLDIWLHEQPFGVRRRRVQAFDRRGLHLGRRARGQQQTRCKRG